MSEHLSCAAKVAGMSLLSIQLFGNNSSSQVWVAAFGLLFHHPLFLGKPDMKAEFFLRILLPPATYWSP